MSARNIVLLLALTTLSLGCDPARTVDRNPPTPTPTSTSTSTSTPAASSTPTPTPTLTPVAPAAPIIKTSPADHRIWIPTTSGPLIVDVDIFIDGVPLSAAHHDWINALLTDIGGDQQAGPPWTNLIDIVGGDSDRFGPNRDAGSMDETTRRYDVDRNGTVDVDEATKFIFQPSAASSIFRVFGTDAYRFGNREESALFALIDSDGDDSLSDQERYQAGTLIRSRLDSNADGSITVTEADSASRVTGDSMRPGNSMLVGAWDRRKSHRRGDVAMDLNGFIDWSSLAYNLSADATTTAFGLNRRLFDELDQDQSDSVGDDEAAMLRSVTADLRIEVRFFDDGELPVVAPEMRVVESAAALSGITESSGSEIVVADESFRLVLRVESFVGGETAECWRYQVRCRAAEVPDAWLAWLDTDFDAVLSAREIADLSERLPADGTPRSVPDTYVVQFGRGDPNLDEVLFSMRGDPLNGRAGPSTSVDSRPMWATAMDANRDGDIARSEFLGTAEQFARLDRNGDGFIDSGEIASKTD